MFVGRKLEEIGWESVPMNDPRITAHPEWLENLQRWAGQNSQSFEIHETVRFERNGDDWRAWLCHPMTYPEFQLSLLWELAASLPTPDEWAYLCGGGCRTLFPWGRWTGITPCICTTLKARKIRQAIRHGAG